MLLDTVKKQIFEAMKGRRPGVPLVQRAKNNVRLSTLKMLSSALTNAEIAKKREKLTEDEELKVVRAEAKKRKDAIGILRQAQDDRSLTTGDVGEKLKREEAELEILKEFLPQDLPDTELEKIVSDSINQSGAKSMADMGKVMQMVMGKTKGRADGKKVASLVKEKLGGQR